jgi:hypothetical protein
MPRILYKSNERVHVYELLLLFFFQLRTAAFKAYCASWVRLPTFATRRLHACHHARAPNGGRWKCGREMSGKFVPQCRLPRYIQGSFTCRKATTWNRWIYFPSEGRRAEDFFALKIRRLWPVANPRTWVPKASSLPLDHWAANVWVTTELHLRR